MVQQHNLPALARELFDSLTDVRSWVSIPDPTTDLRFYDLQMGYRQKKTVSCDSVRVLGYKTPIRLTDVYVNLHVFEKPNAKSRQSVEQLQEEYDRQARKLRKLDRTEAALSVVNRYDRLVLLGKPGSGKTTFTKFVVLTALSNQFERPLLPIWISLKDFSDSSKSLFDYIIEEFDLVGLGHKLTKAFLNVLLEKGNCILLFDGFDEVTSRQKETVSEISQFVKTYNASKVILTCRIASYDYAFSDFTDVELADLTEEQIHRFIERWYRDTPETGASFWSSLNKAENVAIKELAAIPILLNLLCITFGKSRRFLSNKAELYTKALAILLEDWDAERNIQRSEVYKNLSPLRKERLLSRMGYRTFADSMYFVEKEKLETLISEFITDLPETDPRTIKTDSEAILKSIAAHHGLLIERATSVYSFSHLTFQEYFTAKQIKADIGNGSLARLVDTGLFDPRWHEVIVLVANLLDDAEPLFRSMRLALSNHASKFAEIPKLLADAHKIARLNSEYARCTCISFALHAIISRIIEIDKSLGKSSHDLAQCEGIAAEMFLALSTGNYSGKLTNPDFTGISTLAKNRFIHIGNFQRPFGFDPTYDEKVTKYILGTKTLLDCLNTECDVNIQYRRELLYGLLYEGRQENFR